MTTLTNSMTTVLELTKNERDIKRARVEQLLSAATLESRSLTAVERTEIDTLTESVRACTDRIEELTENALREAQVRTSLARFGNPGTSGPLTTAEHRDAPTTATEHRGGHWLDAEIRAVSGASGIGAGFTPPEYASWFWDRLAAQSVALKAGFSVIFTDYDSLVIPTVTGDAAAAWTSEGATITPSDPAGSSITATPRKLTVLTQASSESINDANPSLLQIIADNITRSISLKLDLGMFEGSGTAPEIRGLKNVAGIGSVSMGTNGASPANLDPFADALGTLASGNAEGTAIVMHPRVWQSLSKIKEVSGSAKPVMQASAGAGSDGIVRQIFGVPVFLTSQLSITETQGTSTDCASAYVIQADQCLAVFRSGRGDLGSRQADRSTVARVELDKSRLFNSDQVELRGILRADLVVPNPAAVVRIVGIRP